jgi:oxygen-dependent protoporphyrinogen oxidase
VNVAVIGGGIAGLAAAWELVSGPDPAEVVVFEPDNLGGKIAGSDFAGHHLDMGPDAFIARVPEGIALCRELGIESELVAPEAGRALLWVGGRLRPFPDGLVLGVPTRLGPLVGAGLLTPAGLVRAGLDLVLPASPGNGDVAIGELVSRRFGRQVAERVVDPLLGSIHAGNIDHLSTEATAPQLSAAARRHRSLLIGLRRGASSTTGPMFLTPRSGMSRLVQALISGLKDRGVHFEPTAVTRLARLGTGRVDVDPGGSFAGAVLATPAAATAILVRPTSPVTASELDTIRTASVVLVTLAYPAGALPIPEGSSGFLVPRGEGRLMTACSFASAKWPHWSDGQTTILRVSAGRDGDLRALELDDRTLVERLHDELVAALGASGGPIEARVSRWPNAFPQYDVGHLDRVSRIEQRLAADVPEVVLAGASYLGSGIPACIRSGRRAASVLAARFQPGVDPLHSPHHAGGQ